MYPQYRPLHDASLAGQDTTPTMVHNDFLQLATDNGVLTAVLFMFFVCACLWFIYKSFNKSYHGNKILVHVIA